MSDARRLGWLAASADLILAALLGGFLAAVAPGHLDAIPRPVALLALYVTPAIVGGLGVMAARRSLLISAGLVLVPGALLSMAGVTLVFVIPMVLFIAAATAVGGPAGGRAARLVEILEVIAVAGCIVLAAAAMFVLTANTCQDATSGTGSCGSGVLTVPGVAIEVALLVAGCAIAAWRARVGWESAS